MRHPPISAAPNYTNPALVMLGVNFLWLFFAIWSLFGMIPLLLLALSIHHAIARFGAAKRAGSARA